MEDEKDGKLICERIVPFEDTPRELWLKFPTKEEFLSKEPEMYAILAESEGRDEVVIYLASTKQIKRLGIRYSVRAAGPLIDALSGLVGENNLKLVEKNIENLL